MGFIWAQVQLAVELNGWRKGFFDLLQDAAHHTTSDLWAQMGTFASITLPWVALAAAAAYVARRYAFAWRMAVTEAYLPRWDASRAKVEGASQRIQEDAASFAQIVEQLGKEAIKAALTLIAFVPILWELSAQVGLPALAAVPGSLLWVAAGTSAGGMALSWLVGARLPGLEYQNQVAEAALRRALVLREDVMIHRAPAAVMAPLLARIWENYRRLFLHYGYFDLWANVYGQAMVIVPYLLMGPGLFIGAVTLGTVFQAASAFDEVQSSCSVFIDNWTQVTRLRSIYRRLNEFEKQIA